MPTLTIDGRVVSAPEGATLLDAAPQLNIDVPTLCYHEGLRPFGGCRLCLMETEDSARLVVSCVHPVEEGLALRTRSMLWGCLLHIAVALTMDLLALAARVRALVVTHVHIDHVGRIPYLLAAGFDGPIYCSQPSAVLLPLVLEDALKVGATRDRDLQARILGRLRRQIRPLPYQQWTELDVAGSEPLAVRLQRAGHILGSAYVEFRVGGGRDNEIVVFSGDLGAPWAPLRRSWAYNSFGTLPRVKPWGNSRAAIRSSRVALRPARIRPSSSSRTAL